MMTAVAGLEYLGTKDWEGLVKERSFVDTERINKTKLDTKS